MAWAEWVRTVEVEPSIYAADFANLGSQLEALLRTGTRIAHFDVGAGHFGPPGTGAGLPPVGVGGGPFVPPVAIGPVVLRPISPIVKSFDGKVDCHLMV